MKKDKYDNDPLEEQYEDALFALLMNDFSTKKGQKLIDENDRLKNDLNFRLPDGIEARCEKTISDVFAAKKRKENGKKAKVILSRAAMVALTCGIIFVTLFSTVSAFRESVWSMFTKANIVETDILIQDKNQIIIGKNNVTIPTGAFFPTWVPDGYELCRYNRDISFAEAEFSNDQGDRIIYYEYGNSVVTGADTENADTVENVKINNYDGLIVIKNDSISITWNDSDRKIIARIKSKSIDKELVIKVAESVESNQ